MSIEEERRRIDEVDAEIVRLLAERLKAAHAIGEEKERVGLPVLDAARENRVREKVRRIAIEYGIDPGEIERVYDKIIDSAKSVQSTTVAFQGEAGAFSEQAAIDFFGRAVSTRPCETFDEVFASVAEERTRFGIVPVENSSEGSISRVYDLFLEHDVRVCGETALRIVHCLIGPETLSIGDVRRIYSHPQALAQCHEFLLHLGGELIPAYDTAGAVKMISEQRLEGAAGIASARAAELYHMKVLARGIEDNKNNYTRFFVLSRRDAPPSGNDKTSIVFSVMHALSERRVNLTKIESRPTRQKPWEYNFYIDFEGHRQDPMYAEALEVFGQHCLFLRVLGSYPQAKPVWKTL